MAFEGIVQWWIKKYLEESRVTKVWLENNEHLYFGDGKDVDVSYNGSAWKASVPSKGGLTIHGSDKPRLVIYEDGCTDFPVALYNEGVGSGIAFGTNGVFRIGAYPASYIYQGGNICVSPRIEVSTKTGSISLNGYYNTSSPAVKILVDSDILTANALEIKSGSSADTTVLGIDKNGTLKFTTLNNALGIDFTGIASPNPILKANATAISTAGTLSYQIPIDIGGTTYYIYAYTAGS